MNLRKAPQLLLVGMLAFLAVSSSEPTYSNGLVCPEGQEEQCETMCQQYGRVFGSYIRRCVFEVEMCWCKKKDDDRPGRPGSSLGFG